MKTLGLIGGMSPESTLIYYRLINEGVKARLGGHHSAELILWSVDFAEIESLQRAGDWDTAGLKLAETARRLEAAGAAAVLICANTMHKVADIVADAVDIPLLHIADATAGAIVKARCKRPLLLATKYTMEQEFYRGYLKSKHDIDCLIPNDADRAAVHDIIFAELVQGRVEPTSKKRFREAVARGRLSGMDCVIFGCTEIGLLISQADLAEPVFDTAILHAQAAVDFALSG